MTTPLLFEWDPRKAAENLRKHGVSFDEASTVFDDSLAGIIFDEDHSEEENRYIIMGMSKNDRYLVVGFVDREPKVRIITARAADPKERREYEQRKK